MSNESQKNKVPGWATNPFKEFITHIEELGNLIELSVRGISSLRAMPRISSVIALATGNEEENPDFYQRLAQLAEREVSRGFTLLFAQATIALWSHLESFVKEFLIIWLGNRPSTMLNDEIQHVKIPLAQYGMMNDYEKRYYIVDALERNLQATPKNGVSRFEDLLSAFDLSGPVESELRKNLYELSNVRNVIVHNRGIADRKFLEACPWFDLEAGEIVEVHHQRYDTYQKSVLEYALVIFQRVSEKFGVELHLDENGEWITKDIE